MNTEPIDSKCHWAPCDNAAKCVVKGRGMCLPHGYQLIRAARATDAKRAKKYGR